MRRVRLLKPFPPLSLKSKKALPIIKTILKPVQPAILQFEVVSDGTKMEYVSSELNGWHTYKFVEAKENIGYEISFSEKELERRFKDGTFKKC